MSGNSFDQYRQSNVSSQPVGSIVQAPYNLTDPNYLPCDGRRVSRSLYPKLSACLPSIGTFTATSRTKAAVPTSSAIAADGTNWVVTGPVGTNNLYTTPDGITYTARTTPAACDIRSILNDGTNFVAANGVAGGGAMQYSSNNGVTWNTSATATVGSLATSFQTCMAYAPTLGANGRFCLAQGSSLSAWTSDDRGVTWTARTTGLAASGQIFHVCWTGQKFIATCGTATTIYTSTDGITWVAQLLPFVTTAATATAGSIVSDGSGKVLSILDSNKVITSLDHGVTWAVRFFIEPATTSTVSTSIGHVANYTNSRFSFFSAGTGWLLSSTDLVGWSLTGDIPSPATTAAARAAMSYKAGVYLVNSDNATTQAYTVTEDTSYLRLPLGAQSGSTGSTWNNFIPFIKVQ